MLHVIKNQNRENVWDKSVKIQENLYYWKGEPVIYKKDFPTNDKFKVAEFFSGCGGTSKGFEMAGFDIVFGADIHRPSAETFLKNHNHATVVLGDLKKISASKVKEILGSNFVDVTIAGVPCQGFSLNNRKRIESDERNYLFREYMKFVKELSPSVVVLENVSGMRSTANGAFVDAIERAMIDAGYPNVKHKMLNAADFGVPQLRNRLVFVATKEGMEFGWPKETYGPKAKRPYVTVGEAINDLPYLDPAENANEYDSEPRTEYQKMMRSKVGKKLTNHLAPNHPENTIVKIANTKPGEPMYPKFKQRIRLSWSKPSPTQVSGGIRPQFQFGHPEWPRGLTIRERLRIQSFPDDFEVVGGIVQGRVQTGNAVPPLLAKAIAQEIKITLNNKNKKNV